MKPFLCSQNLATNGLPNYAPADVKFEPPTNTDGIAEVRVALELTARYKIPGSSHQHIVRLFVIEVFSDQESEPEIVQIGQELAPDTVFDPNLAGNCEAEIKKSDGHHHEIYVGEPVFRWFHVLVKG